jgi:hypothetical protein
MNNDVLPQNMNYILPQNMNYILQTILFPKNTYTIDNVKEYLKENKYKDSKLDITNNFIRVRQRDPRYLRRKGLNYIKTIIDKKTGIHKIIFYSPSSV